MAATETVCALSALAAPAEFEAVKRTTSLSPTSFGRRAVCPRRCPRDRVARCSGAATPLISEPDRRRARPAAGGRAECPTDFRHARDRGPGRVLRRLAAGRQLCLHDGRALAHHRDVTRAVRSDHLETEGVAQVGGDGLVGRVRCAGNRRAAQTDGARGAAMPAVGESQRPRPAPGAGMRLQHLAHPGVPRESRQRDRPRHAGAPIAPAIVAEEALPVTPTATASSAPRAATASRRLRLRTSRFLIRCLLPSENCRGDQSMDVPRQARPAYSQV